MQSNGVGAVPVAATWSSRIALVWGSFGVFASLIEAIFRLLPLALEPLEQGMSALGYAAYGGFVLFNAYVEGYRGFQRSFSPRLAARALVLAREPTLARVVLAPLFLMGLFDATRRRLAIGWTLVAAIVTLIVAIRFAGQPLRGIVDAGVVVGLGWGLVATVIAMFRAFAGEAPPVDPELPSAS